jgi:hypothetical protein
VELPQAAINIAMNKPKAMSKERLRNIVYSPSAFVLPERAALTRSALARRIDALNLSTVEAIISYLMSVHISTPISKLDSWQVTTSTSYVQDVTLLPVPAHPDKDFREELY